MLTGRFSRAVSSYAGAAEGDRTINYLEGMPSFRRHLMYGSLTLAPFHLLLVATRRHSTSMANNDETFAMLTG